MERVPCTVLAGGKAKPELQALTGQENRALVVVQGRRMLDTVVSALLSSECVGQIVVVGEVPPSSDFITIADRGSFVGNVMAGAEQFQQEEFLLYATCDLPFLTGESVARFVQKAVEVAKKSNASILYPIIPVERCYARFPSVKRTSLKLREGNFTGGNLMLVRPATLAKQKAQIESAYSARKSPLRLATLLGIGTVLKLIIAQTVLPNILQLAYLEAGVSRLLGTEARAVICDDVEIATDLDRPSDFEALGVRTER
jgi:hypothetical protein